MAPSDPTSRPRSSAGAAPMGGPADSHPAQIAALESAALDRFTELDRDTVIAILNGEVEITGVDNEAISREILTRMLEAADADELFGEMPGTVSTDDLIGEPVQINSYQVRPSTKGSGVYMLCEAVRLSTGEVFTMTTGARNIMVQLYRAAQLGILPVQVRVQQSAEATEAGYHPLRLTKL